MEGNLPVNTQMTSINGSADSGQARPNELGNNQEPKQDRLVLICVAVSFLIISVFTGFTVVYNTKLTYGVPLHIVYGWLLVDVLTLIVGFSIVEIFSSYPTSGGLYCWSAKLAGPSWAPFASWITGWFNIVGQWAVTTSVDFSLAQLISLIIFLSTGGTNGGGYQASKYVVIAIHAAILLMHAILNTFLPVIWLLLQGVLALLWNFICVFFLTRSVPDVSMAKDIPEFVFTHFDSNNVNRINSKLNIFFLGLVMSRYTMTGYDAPAHMTGETRNSNCSNPFAIIPFIWLSVIVGWNYIMGITIAVTDNSRLSDTGNDAGGDAINEIFYRAVNYYGNGVGGIIFFSIIAVAVFFWGMSCITSNSRMAYAFARDGAMPFSTVWQRVNGRGVPINAVWLSAFIAFCMALTSLGSVVAYEAMLSIAAIGLYISHGLPIFFRVTLGRRSFVPIPIFNLGRCGVVVGWIAVLWVVTISVLFSFPVSYPVTPQTLNYTPVAMGGLLILTVSYWVLSARHWFNGPMTNITPN